MSDRLTLATSTGLPFLVLALHVATGVVALLAGSAAIVVRKGGKRHRQTGIVFVYTMTATGLLAAVISVYEGKSAVAGLLTAYFVFTGWTALNPLRIAARQVDIALMGFAFVIAAAGIARAFSSLDRPGNHIDGVPAGMLFFMATMNSLAAIGDARMVVARGIQGTRRVARHLWRMCFGLFIATGSFVAQLALMKFLPAPFRSVAVIVTLAAGPLLMMLYWLWRVRLRQNLRGLVTAKATELPRPA